MLLMFWARMILMLLVKIFGPAEYVLKNVTPIRATKKGVFYEKRGSSKLVTPRESESAVCYPDRLI